jgi:hypothetical protein
MPAFYAAPRQKLWPLDGPAFAQRRATMMSPTQNDPITSTPASAAPKLPALRIRTGLRAGLASNVQKKADDTASGLQSKIG